MVLFNMLNFILLNVPRRCFFCGSLLLFMFHVYLCYGVLPCEHLVERCHPLSSLVCHVFLCFCHFPIWCSVSGMVLDCIDFWSLPSSVLLKVHISDNQLNVGSQSRCHKQSRRQLVTIPTNSHTKQTYVADVYQLQNSCPRDCSRGNL